MKKKKNYYLKIFTALLLLVNPNIHIVDILPDFIAYFLIFSVISEAAGLAPHFEQAKDACKKLAILCLFKIPASFITVSVNSNNITDKNLIPTFAIVFAVFEMILGYTFIFHLSEGLFYLGQRTDATALISPFRTKKGAKENAASGTLSERRHTPEALRNASLLFLFVKGFASFLPELLLLTRKQEYVGDLSGQMSLAKLYPYALLLIATITLAIGIYWLVMARAYMKAVRKEGKFLNSLLALAGDTLIAKKEKHELCSAYVLGFSLIAIASLFSMNFMPLFYFALFLLLGAVWIRIEKPLRGLTRIFGALSLTSSAVLSILIKEFDANYGYHRLLKDEEAIRAYQPCVLVSVLTAILFIAFLVCILIALNRTVKGAFGTKDSGEKKETRYKKTLLNMNLAFFILAALSVICRSIYVYLQGKVIFIPSSAAAVGTYSHQWEFWPLIMTVIAIPFIIYTFYYMGVLKEEAKLCLDEEEF